MLMTNVVFCQKDQVKKIITEINFEQDTVKAVYKWVAENIRYDVKKLAEIKQRGRKRKNDKFKTEEEYDQYQLRQIIKTKKGVCEGYSLLFDALLKELGYTSHIIEGYTKNHKGKLNTSVGHAWNAVEVNGVWKLFDTTWGSGYVQNESKFIKRYNEDWYDVSPEKMIVNHMPYDPIWQLSDDPLSYQGFEKVNDQRLGQENFDHAQLIENYLQSSTKDQLKLKLERSMACGDGIRLVGKYQKYLSKKVEMTGLIGKEGDYMVAQDKYKKAVGLLNEFIKAKNKRFKGEKYSQAIASEKLNEAQEETEQCIEILKNTNVKQRKIAASINKSIKYSKQLLRQIEKEQEFLTSLN